MNLKGLVKKLQIALSQKGIYCSVNQFQRYSEKAGRMVVKFVVVRREEGEEPLTIYEGYKMAEVAVCLADILKEGGED